MVSYIFCQALGKNRPKLLTVLCAALGNAELVADALCNIAGTVILAELIVEIADGAREADKLITAELAEIELFLIFLGNYAGDGTEALNALGQTGIFEQLVEKLDVAADKLVKAVVAVLGDEFVYNIYAPLGYAVLFRRCRSVIIKAYYLTEYREAVVYGLVDLLDRLDRTAAYLLRRLVVRGTDAYENRVFEIRDIFFFLKRGNYLRNRGLIVLALELKPLKHRLRFLVETLCVHDDVAVVYFDEYAWVNVDHDNAVVRKLNALHAGGERYLIIIHLRAVERHYTRSEENHGKACCDGRDDTA